MDDPWFTYERGRGRPRVTPRNAKGVLATVALVVFLTSVPLAVPLLGLPPLLTLAWLPILLVALFAFINWAKTKSERVEPVNSEELAEFREWKRRQGRN